jgi:hypothetical protein
MSPRKRQAAVEFLQFLADISDPGTGVISSEKLAARLAMSDADLRQHWSDRGGVTWKVFVDELLAVLDIAQEHTHNLNQAIVWYRHSSIEVFGSRTPDRIVIEGEARKLVRAIRRNAVRIAIAA